MPKITVDARVIARKAPGARGLAEGLIWVEAYRPFDPQALADFEALARKTPTPEGKPDYRKAANTDPALAKKALDPIDSHGEAMLQEDLVQLAHGFLALSRKMDVQHDGKARGSVTLVESFVNTPEISSPNFAAGAWVVVFKVAPDSPEWADIEAGNLNAVSFQAVVTKQPITVSLRSAA